MLHRNKLLVVFFLIVFSLTVLPSCRLKDQIEENKDYSGIELTYYKLGDDGEVIQPMIDQFLVNYPGLKIHYKKFSDFAEYQKTILDEMSEGEGPDIFSMPNTWFASNYKKLAPMPKEYGKPKDFAETFVSTAYQDLVRVDDDGLEQIFGLPMSVDTLGLYYNKDYFEDKIPTRGRPADTWEGIKEDVALLNKPNNSFERFEVSGMAMGRADNIANAIDVLYMLFLQNGVKFYNANISAATFANPGENSTSVETPAETAVKLYLSFANQNQKYYSWNESLADLRDKDIRAFAQGKVAMIFGYSYTYDEILNQIEILKSQGVKTIEQDVIKVSPVPQLYDPEASKEKRVAYANYFAETVSRNSKQGDIAWDFLVSLTSNDNLKYYFDKTHKPTSRRDLIEKQEEHPIYGAFVSQIGYAESFPIVNYEQYTKIFENIITLGALPENSLPVLILDAEDEITSFLPRDGLVKPKRDLPEEEKEEESGT